MSYIKMKTKIIKDNEELKSYIKNGVITFNCNIVCGFNINVDADINAYNISAWNINARNIDAWDINARDINARDIDAWNINTRNILSNNISYHAVCFSYNNIVCDSISGKKRNGRHFCINGEITVRNSKKKITIDGKDIEISEESFKELKKQLCEE